MGASAFFYGGVICDRWQWVEAQFTSLLMKDNRDLQEHCFYIYEAPTAQHSPPYLAITCLTSVYFYVVYNTESKGPPERERLIRNALSVLHRVVMWLFHAEWSRSHLLIAVS